MGVFAATRIIAVLTFALLRGHGIFRAIPSVWGWLTEDMDAAWYAGLAQHGYPPDKIAFFHFYPGYPLAIDTIAWIPGMGVHRAGIAVVSIAGLAAAAGLARLGMRVTGDWRVSLLLVALWAAAPGAMVLSMAYPEALVCALAAWALVAVADQRWILAGVLTLAAGTVHSSAVVLMAALGVAALLAVIRSARTGWRPLGAWLRPVAAVAISPVGLIAFWVFVSVRQQQPGSWFTDERQAGTFIDWGVSTFHAVVSNLLSLPSPPEILLDTLVIIAAVVLAAWILTESIPAYLKVYAVGNVALTVLTNAEFLGSKPRYLIPALLLGYPLAKLLRPAPGYVLIPLIAILAAASAWLTLAQTAIGIAP